MSSRRARRRRRQRRAALGGSLKVALRRARWGVFALIPVGVMLAAAELGARALESATPESEPSATTEGVRMAPHQTRIWGLRPGEHEAFDARLRVDGDGLRASQTSGAALRLLTLGDSSIFGHGLEDQDTLHVQLGAALRDRGVDVDALCGGIPGYSTLQSRLLLDELGWDLEPDLLVVGNLWSDNNFDTFVDAEWLAELHAPGRQLELSLRSNSAAWRRLRGLDPLEAASGPRSVSWIRDPYERGRRRVSLSAYAAALDGILLAAAERGVGAIVLQPANQDRLRGVTPATWDPYFEAQSRVAARRGVPIVDALEALRGAGLDVESAFLDEMHPTAAANASYAEALADALVGAGWPGDTLVPDGAPAPFEEALEDVWSEPLAPYQEGLVPSGPPPSGPKPPLGDLPAGG